MNKAFYVIVLLSIFSCSKSGHKNKNNTDVILPTSEVKIEKEESVSDLNSHISEKKSLEIIEEVTHLKNKIELPFTSDSGVKIVRIKVNDVPLDFIFDTGASLISISETEARFLVKQGTLTEEDFLGVQQFVDANGDISEGLLVNLKEIDIQGFKIQNVKASIVQNNQAPLLLGQSLIEKFAQITIDNKNEKIILE